MQIHARSYSCATVCDTCGEKYESFVSNLPDGWARTTVQVSNRGDMLQLGEPRDACPKCRAGAAPPESPPNISHYLDLPTDAPGNLSRLEGRLGGCTIGKASLAVFVGEQGYRAELGPGKLEQLAAWCRGAAQILRRQ